MLVRLPFKEDQGKAAMRGIAISHWLKENGLELTKDYTWALMSTEREIHFIFRPGNESWASMLAIKEL